MRKILFAALFLVASLTDAQPGQGQAEDPTGLKDAYADYFKIGVAVNQRNISDEAQASLVMKEFNSITAENDMKPLLVHPEEGKWTW